MTCAVCHSKAHSTKGHFSLKEKIEDKGFPTHPKDKYERAHHLANKMEKAKYPKGYEELKKQERTLGKNELLGKNLKNGKVEVSEKVSPKRRAEVAYHERVESKALRKK